jgi:hypothetical protein
VSDTACPFFSSSAAAAAREAATAAAAATLGCTLVMDGMESSDDAWFVLLRGKEAEEVKGWAELSEMRVVVSDAR